MTNLAKAKAAVAAVRLARNPPHSMVYVFVSMLHPNGCNNKDANTTTALSDNVGPSAWVALSAHRPGTARADRGSWRRRRAGHLGRGGGG